MRFPSHCTSTAAIECESAYECVTESSYQSSTHYHFLLSQDGIIYGSNRMQIYQRRRQLQPILLQEQEGYQEKHRWQKDRRLQSESHKERKQIRCEQTCLRFAWTVRFGVSVGILWTPSLLRCTLSLQKKDTGHTIGTYARSLEWIIAMQDRSRRSPSLKDSG